MSAQLIPQDEMTTLKPASEVKSVADVAESLIEQAAMANLINSAANTGQHSAIWEHPLSEELKIVLEGQGYKLKNYSDRRIDQWVVSGF